MPAAARAAAGAGAGACTGYISKHGKPGRINGPNVAGSSLGHTMTCKDWLRIQSKNQTQLRVIDNVERSHKD